jgi:predicted Zn-dependent protease
MNGKVKEKNGVHTPTVAFLERDQIDFLDKLNKDYFAKFGHHLSRGHMLCELVDCLMRLNLDLNELDQDKENLCDFILRKAKDAQTPCS